MSMLDICQKALFAKYPPTDPVGLFVSLFDEKKTLLMSQGVVETDKPLGQLITMLYNGLMAKYPAATSAILDVVTELTQQTTVEALLALDYATHGIVLTNPNLNKSGSMLPGLAGIKDMKQAYALVKQKYGFDDTVVPYSFTTQRMEVKF